MVAVGTLVKFVWWTDYKAPSAGTDDKGHSSWHEIHPGDKGVVLCVKDDYVVVLFSGVDTLLRLPHAMVEAL